MRIPLSKVYRAFPEFDPFPDDECERYLRYARRQARFRLGCIPLVAFGIAFVVWVTIASLVVRMLYSMKLLPDDVAIVPLTFLISSCAFPAILALIVRDKLLLRVLHDRIKSARCPACEFSLLGLPVRDGAARCPECGTNIVLRMHNLTPEDLMIRRVGEDDAPDEGYDKCAACGFEVRGVTIVKNSVRCPECGHVETLHKRAILQSLHDGRMPEGFVDATARVTTCPGCAKSLLGTPVFEGQARCMECGFIANVVRRPGEGDEPPQESASEVGLRIKRLRGEPDEKRNSEGAERAEGSRDEGQ